MRWDEQRVENDMRLPGIGDGTVVRTFDAPEAMGINFHEVRARSALNHVAGDSFGFSWTINPYRGCTHACVFCFARKTHTFLDLDAGKDFEREIVVKVNTPEIVRAELRRPSWKRDLVALRRTPIRISGVRAATGCCRRSLRRCWRLGRRSRC
jgi:hypothetical protein